MIATYRVEEIALTERPVLCAVCSSRTAGRRFRLHGTRGPKCWFAICCWCERSERVAQLRRLFRAANPDSRATAAKTNDDPGDDARPGTTHDGGGAPAKTNNTHTKEDQEMATKRKSKMATPKRATATHMSDERIPPIGSTITREYKGDALKIRVAANGFVLDGKTYASATALAQKVTGAPSINGPLWLGLTRRPAAKTGARKAGAPRARQPEKAPPATPRTPPKPARPGKPAGTPAQAASVAKAREARAAKAAARQAETTAPGTPATSTPAEGGPTP